MTDLSQEKARIMARAILESEDVRASLTRRLIAGTLPEEIEVLLWELAYPPPRLRAAHEPEVRRRPTLAFTAPLSADEVDTRIQAAALDGDVEAVVALTPYQERKS